MSRYIDADMLLAECEKAEKTMEKHGQEYSYSFMSSSQEISTEWYFVEELINNAPTADVRENVKGEWVGHLINDKHRSIDEDCCSICGERFYQIAETGCTWNFCPYCGADMRPISHEEIMRYGEIVGNGYIAGVNSVEDADMRGEENG